MPGCPHEGHTHHPWPSAGPLVICPGERTCGYCKGKDGKINHGKRGMHAWLETRLVCLLVLTQRPLV